MGVFSVSIVFRAVTLNEVTRGMSVDRKDIKGLSQSHLEVTRKEQPVWEENQE